MLPRKPERLLENVECARGLRGILTACGELLHQR